jgi:hypothetical protein
VAKNVRMFGVVPAFIQFRRGKRGQKLLDPVRKCIYFVFVRRFVMGDTMLCYSGLARI